MENRYSEKEAKSAVTRYRRRGANVDLALRAYTAGLLGAEQSLVLHGGGNASVKTRARDLAGAAVDALCVKASGTDMAAIAPMGFPALKLDQLLKLAALEDLSDAEMASALRGNLLDGTAADPSVETLLHAFLAPKFIDHTHAGAVLALTNQPNGAELCADVFGAQVAIVPYVRSGFSLAKAARKSLEGAPGAEGLILLKHGIVSFGDSAEESYGRMISLVSRAEDRLNKGARKVFAARPLPKTFAGIAEIAPILRGTVALPGARAGDYRRMILDFRTGPHILDFVNGRDLDRYGQAGLATPDFVIRTKPKPLIVPAPRAGATEMFTIAVKAALEAYQADYNSYFGDNNARFGNSKTGLDPMPRVILVPGQGLFGLGRSAAAAAIAADLAESNIKTITAAERIGVFEGLSEEDLFDIEYWPPEQAKIAAPESKSLAGQIVAITGGASGIGAATARAFADEGAAVAILDLDGDAAKQLAHTLGGLGIACDVTSPKAVGAAFDAIAETFGGVDIVISNAGGAWEGEIGTVADEILRKSFELNFFAHQTVAQNAVRVMRAQGTGGVLLFNTSKQAINPGREFGPYGLPKAATLFLVRQYALDHGADGIRASAVNADRVRTGMLDDDMIASRARARMVSRRDYMAGNLLGREVLAEDVAQAFLSLALARNTTGAVLTVDGGNIEAALR